MRPSVPAGYGDRNQIPTEVYKEMIMVREVDVPAFAVATRACR